MATSFEKIKSETDDEQSDAVTYKILPYPADFTLEGLYLKWTKEEIKIPPFQRQYVWNQAQASRLVESFLLGLPVPGIFLYKEKSTEKLLVIDGQQRLRSIVSYLSGKYEPTGKKFSLTKAKPAWDGKTFEQLSEPEKSRLKDSVLRATIIQQLDPNDDSSIIHIFERLNTGGTTLVPQEVRNCVYNGKFNDLLLELNKFKYWREILGKKKLDPRMKDVELILRSFALTFNADEYHKPMKDFLSAFMKKNQNPSPQKLVAWKKLFTSAVTRTVSSLGARPFHLRAGMNVAACDSVLVAFMRNQRIPTNIQKRYSRLIENEAFLSYTADATTDVDTVKKRIELADKVLFG